MQDYKREVGRRLRAVRQLQGLTLAEVEERSDGEWKAVVVGSYERGDRGISVARLSSLAAFYGVPVGHLLPPDDPGDDRLRPAAIDLALLAAHGDRFATLRRFVERIQQDRGDFNGRVLTLRSDDVAALAAATGRAPERLLAELRRSGILSGSGVTAAPRPATAR